MLSRTGRLARRLTPFVWHGIRGAGRLTVLVLVASFYVMGAAAAAVVVAALTVSGAVRLGWSDTRKRAHGPA